MLGSFSGGGVDSIVRRIPVLAFLAVMFYHCSGGVAPISRHGCLHIRPGGLHFKAWGAVNCKVINTFRVVAVRALILIPFNGLVVLEAIFPRSCKDAVSCKGPMVYFLVGLLAFRVGPLSLR